MIERLRQATAGRARSARPHGPASRWLKAGACGLLLGHSSAWCAGGDAPSFDPAYAEECGSCHVPYAANLLPAASWQNVLQGLAKHFGVDAAITDDELAPIRGYLLAHARRKQKGETDDAPPRITTAHWFRRTHADVARGHWPEHRSAANCEACHPGAAQGRYRQLSDPDYGVEP